MNQNSRKETPNTGAEGFFWKSVFDEKVPKKVHNFWRFVVVGPFSTEDPKKKKNQHTAEQPGKTPPSQFAPQDRGAKEEEKEQEQKKQKEEAAEEKKKKRRTKKKKKKKKSKKAKEQGRRKKRGRTRPIRGKTEVSWRRIFTKEQGKQ